MKNHLKNHIGLKQFVSTLNGVMFVGKRKVELNSSYLEDVFTISTNNRNKEINLSKDEALKLKREIELAYPTN
jgi:hypothetical protein